MSLFTYNDFGKREYVFKINPKAPMWTRCSDCGESWTKAILRPKCPSCGIRGSLVLFRRYDFPHCPLCDHPEPREERKPRLLSKCVMCGI